MRLHVAYSRPRPEDELGRHYDSAGRVDGALLEKLVPGLDGDFYLCGPTGFMASVQEHLEARGVPPERIPEARPSDAEPQASLISRGFGRPTPLRS